MEQFGRFQLAEPLDQWDTWQSFRAYAQSGSIVRPVLLKREPVHQAGKPLFEEAQILSRLSHPNIFAFVDAGEVSNWSFVALGWVPGRPLSALIDAARARNLSFDLHAALFVMINALQGLAHAHEQSDGQGGLLGIVHRDVGPHSIHIGYAGQVLVGGFGYAEYRGRASPAPVPGFPESRHEYASPEQALGDAIDHRADIFSAGLLLYELLAGRPAHESRSPLEARARAQRGAVPPLEGVAPHLPSEVIHVVERALVLDRNARHPSAQVFRDELQRLLYTREPTYGPHRLASMTALLLGEEAAEDGRRDHEARMSLSGRPVSTPMPARQVAGPTPPPAAMMMTPAFGAPAPMAPTPAFGIPPPTTGSAPKLPPTRTTSDIRAELDAFSGEHSLAPGEALPFRPETGELEGLRVLGSTSPANLSSASSVAVAEPPRSERHFDPMQAGAFEEPAPMSMAASSSISAPSGTLGPAPSAFDEKSSNLGKIIGAVVGLALVGMLAFTFSSPKNTRLVTRKMKAAVVGRKPGGILTIESIPPGAKLIVDDEDTGRKTPVTIENFESGGVHDIALEIEGEPTETATVSITAGQKKTLNILFKNAVVSFGVKTDPPGAELWVDGRSLALTPASLSLRTNKEVAIKISKIGYVDVEQKLVPEPGKPVELNLTLEKSEEMKAAEAAEAAALKAAEEEAGGGKKKKKR